MKLNIEAVPVPRGYVHPPPPHDVLPKHEFSMGIIAPKGSGKTTLIVNLLKFYRGYFHNIIVFSPTVASDEKWDVVKELPLLADNKPLKDFVKSLEEEEPQMDGVVVRKKAASELSQMVSTDPLIDRRVPESNFYTEYTKDALSEIMQEQMAMVKILKAYGKSKHLANRFLIIFDDLVGSSLFGSEKQNPFKMLNTNHRHYSASIIMVSQAYKEIPKTVRTNFSCLIIFEIPNDKEIEVIFEENSLYMKRPDWQEAYKYAVDGDHDFMFINYQKPKRLRLMRNFDQVLFVDK